MNIPFAYYYPSTEAVKKKSLLRKQWELFYSNWNGSDRKKNRIIQLKVKKGKIPQSKQL